MQMKLKCLGTLPLIYNDVQKVFTRITNVSGLRYQSQGIKMLQVCDTRRNRLCELPLVHSTLLVVYNMYCVIIG